MITKNTTAMTTNPMPVARPMAVARNTRPISFALPGALRKRIRLKAPATATPAPMLPLTIIMMIWIIAGSMARVTIKLWEYLDRNMPRAAVPSPSSSETAVQIKNADVVISVPVMIELSTENNLRFYLCRFTAEDKLFIIRSVFGKRCGEDPVFESRRASHSGAVPGILISIRIRSSSRSGMP